MKTIWTGLIGTGAVLTVAVLYVASSKQEQTRQDVIVHQKTIDVESAQFDQDFHQASSEIGPHSKKPTAKQKKRDQDHIDSAKKSLEEAETQQTEITERDEKDLRDMKKALDDSTGGNK